MVSELRRYCKKATYHNTGDKSSYALRDGNRTNEDSEGIRIAQNPDTPGKIELYDHGDQACHYWEIDWVNIGLC